MIMMMMPSDGREGSGTAGIKYQEYQTAFNGIGSIGTQRKSSKETS